MRVLIITGGTSSERKISFMSAGQVKEGLEEAGHKVKLFDLKKGFKELKKIIKEFDVIFPVIHGEEGEGGELQKFLEKSGKPFVGGDWRGYKKGWFKIPFKKWCQENSIPTSKWKLISTKEDIIKFGFPCVLKSSSGGSSKEVVILKSKKDLGGYKIKKLLNSNLKLFVEHFIKGVEVTVAILHNKALPVLEIIPPEGGWFDYKNKYWGNTKEIPHAPSLDGKTRQQAQKIALKIHQTLNLGPYSRIDFIVASHIGSSPRSAGGAGGNTVPYVLEVNTIPGLTASSLFPKAAQAAGLSFSNMLSELINLSAFINSSPALAGLPPG